MAKPSFISKACLLSTLLLFSVGPSTAAPKTAVFIKHVGNDAVGDRFTYALREEITKSARYQLYAGDKLQPGSAVLEVEIVSIDADPDHQGVSSAISVLIDLRAQRPTEQSMICGEEATKNLHHEVNLIGAARADQTAEELMGELDKATEGFGN